MTVSSQGGPSSYLIGGIISLRRVTTLFLTNTVYDLGFRVTKSCYLYIKNKYSVRSCPTTCPRRSKSTGPKKEDHQYGGGSSNFKGGLGT